MQILLVAGVVVALLLILGLCVLCVSTFIYAFSHEIWLFILASSIQGIAASTASSRAARRDLRSKSGR